MSGGGGSEVSKKIRAAIKAKLEELGAYVDEELPDYIMVMIANKKTKAQMKDDLQLFLGKNATKFVDWLFEIFERLQAANKASASGSGEPAEEKSKKKSTKEKKKEKSKKEKSASGGKKGHKHKKARDGADGPQPAKKLKRTKSPTKPPPESSQQASGKKKEEKENEGVVEVKKPEEVGKSEVIATLNESTEKNRVEEDLIEAEDQLQIHAQSVGDAIDEEISMARKEREVETGKGRRRISPPSRSPNRDNTGLKRNVVRVQPMRHEHHPPSSSDQRSSGRQVSSGSGGGGGNIQQLASVVAFVGSTNNDHSQRNVHRKVASSVSGSITAPITGLFAKALHEAGKKPSDKLSRIRKRPNAGSQSEESASEHDGSADGEEERSRHKKRHKKSKKKSKDRDGSSESKTKSRRKVELKTGFDHEKNKDSHRKTPLKEAKEAETESKSGEHKTRFVITMTGLSDSFHRKMDGEEESDIAPKKHKLVKVEKAYSPPPKPKIVKHMPEQKPSKPVKLKLAHRRESNEQQQTKSSEHQVKSTSQEEERELEEESSSSGSEGSVGGQPIPVLDTRQVVSKPGQSTPLWSAHLNPVSISLDDDDDEEEIDAVINGSNGGNFVSGSFEGDGELPPTQSLTRSHSVGSASSQHTQHGSSQQQQLMANKIMERCKFWPACREGESCQYVHPTKHCLTFPKCPYADRCIYIHPNCKYDQTCSRLNCPYTHAGKKGSSQGPAPQAPPKHHKPPPTHYSSTGTHKSISVPCRFGPKCTNVRCPYQHPKPCHYGADCLNDSCKFVHPKKPGAVGDPKKARFKWQAAASSQKTSEPTPDVALSKN